MITHKIGVQKSTGKIREIGGVKKGCFLRGRRRGQKWGNGLEQGEGRGVKKFLRGVRGVVEWGRIEVQSKQIF